MCSSIRDQYLKDMAKYQLGMRMILDSMSEILHKRLSQGYKDRLVIKGLNVDDYIERLDYYCGDRKIFQMDRLKQDTAHCYSAADPNGFFVDMVNVDPEGIPSRLEFMEFIERGMMVMFDLYTGIQYNLEDAIKEYRRIKDHEPKLKIEDPKFDVLVHDRESSNGDKYFTVTIRYQSFDIASDFPLTQKVVNYFSSSNKEL